VDPKDLLLRGFLVLRRRAITDARDLFKELRPVVELPSPEPPLLRDAV
jgi:hypothetical protein